MGVEIGESDPQALTRLGRLLLDFEDTAPTAAAAREIGLHGGPDQLRVLLSAYAVGPDQTSWTLGGALNHAVFWRNFDIDALVADGSEWAFCAAGAAEFKAWAHIGPAPPPLSSPAGRRPSLSWAAAKESQGVEGARQALIYLTNRTDDEIIPAVAALYGRMLIGPEQYSPASREGGAKLAKACCEHLLSHPDARAVDVLLAGMAVAREERVQLICQAIVDRLDDVGPERLVALGDSPDPWVATSAKRLVRWAV